MEEEIDFVVFEWSFEGGGKMKVTLSTGIDINDALNVLEGLIELKRECINK